MLTPYFCGFPKTLSSWERGRRRTRLARWACPDCGGTGGPERWAELVWTTFHSYLQEIEEGYRVCSRHLSDRNRNLPLILQQRRIFNRIDRNASSSDIWIFCYRLYTGCSGKILLFPYEFSVAICRR